jgi:hypothetical protein
VPPAWCHDRKDMVSRGLGDAYIRQRLLERFVYIMEGYWKSPSRMPETHPLYPEVMQLLQPSQSPSPLSAPPSHPKAPQPPSVPLPPISSKS